jgi:Flp pilus assembly protein TadG
MMPMRFNLPRFVSAKFLADRRGIAAVEFALIAPALIFLVMGVLELSFRFRAADDATRYVHQVADLISREPILTEAGLEDIYAASTHMMMPLDTTDNLDLDVASIGFEGNDATPKLFWRRVAGSPVSFSLTEAEGMGVEDESVIRVGVRYTYESVISSLFGGPTMAIERSAYARPREERLVSMDGQTDDGGATQYIGS